MDPCFSVSVPATAFAPFLARLEGVAFGSLGFVGPRLRFGGGVLVSVTSPESPLASGLDGVVGFLARPFLGVSALGVISVSASPASASAGSVLVTLPRFLGAALVGVGSSSSSALPSVVALALAFLGVAAVVITLLTTAPAKSFFLTVRKQALAEAAVL